MSVMAANTMRFGAIILISAVMVLLNILSSSSCTQLQKRKGGLEREIARLDDERIRESSLWEKMTTPENVERTLLKHGLAMKVPRPDQTVRLRADGTPRLGQLSVARAEARRGVTTASVRAKPSSRTSPRKRR